MVEGDRDCVNALTQINAVRVALHKVEELVEIIGRMPG
jgi:DNA-binding FrmR family transcriptional regulator